MIEKIHKTPQVPSSVNNKSVDETNPTFISLIPILRPELGTISVFLKLFNNKKKYF